jgi:hypothetical protein
MRGMANTLDTRDAARVLLACIRLFNGLAALLAPHMLAQRLGIDAENNPAAVYMMRMFGIRTVLIGADLLLEKGERRKEALRLGIVVHASDTLAAYLAAKTGKLPGNMGRTIVAISTFNTALALYASRLGR